MSTITVRKRDNAWEYRIYLGIIDGKAKRLSRSGFGSKREAHSAAEEALRRYSGNQNQPQVRQTMSYGAFLDYWLDSYCVPNLKQTSVFDYRKRISSVIKPRLGSYSIQALTPLLLQQFITEIFNAGYSRNAIVTIKGIVSASLKYAVVPAGLLMTNPAACIRLPLQRAKPKVAARQHKRIAITADQWARIMTRFPELHPSHIVLNLGYHLGLRLGEAFGLLWEDIDFERMTVSVNRQVQYDDERKCWYFTEPKYESFRTIAMDPSLAALLSQERSRQLRAEEYYGERYARIRIDDEQHFSEVGALIHPVNVRENGTYIQPRTTQHINHVIQTELGLPTFDFHTLRHTHATMLIEAGADIMDVQERLGHTKVDMTARYIHNTDQQRERTRCLLRDLYSPGT